MAILIIANPISGGGRAARLAARLRARLEAAGHGVELFLTSRSGDARARAARSIEGIDRIVSVGGDGTFNEVLNGLDDPSRVPLTQLATGTANLLAHDLALPRDAEGLYRLLEGGRIRRLDMGLAGDRRFLMVASCGFDAMVTLETQGRRRGPMGYVNWLPAILRVARSYRPPRLSIRVDGRAPIEGGWAVVSNVRNYGGLFTVTDRAVIDSGHLDVCVLRRASLPGLLAAAFRALGRGLSGHRDVVYLEGREITVSSPEPVPVEIDGDPHGVTPLEIRLIPRHVPVVVPVTSPDPRLNGSRRQRGS